MEKGGGGGRVTDATSSPCPPKPISQQILSQLTNWGKWAWQKIMDYLTSTQHPVCSQEGSDSFKIHLQWGWPYGSAYRKITVLSLSYTISLWYLFLELFCTAIAIMYPFAFTFFSECLLLLQLLNNISQNDCQQPLKKPTQMYMARLKSKFAHPSLLKMQNILWPH